MVPIKSQSWRQISMILIYFNGFFNLQLFNKSAKYFYRLIHAYSFVACWEEIFGSIFHVITLPYLLFYYANLYFLCIFQFWNLFLKIGELFFYHYFCYTEVLRGPRNAKKSKNNLNINILIYPQLAWKSL